MTQQEKNMTADQLRNVANHIREQLPGGREPVNSHETAKWLTDLNAVTSAVALMGRVDTPTTPYEFPVEAKAPIPAPNPAPSQDPFVLERVPPKPKDEVRSGRPFRVYAAAPVRVMLEEMAVETGLSRSAVAKKAIEYAYARLVIK